MEPQDASDSFMHEFYREQLIRRTAYVLQEKRHRILNELQYFADQLDLFLPPPTHNPASESSETADILDQALQRLEDPYFASWMRVNLENRHH